MFVIHSCLPHYEISHIINLKSRASFAPLTQTLSVSNSIFIRFHLAFAFALLGAQQTHAQASEEEQWTRTYESALKKCQSSSSCLELEALRLFPVSNEEDCGTAMQRSALLLFNRTPEDVQRLSGLTKLAGCDTSFSQLRYNLGMLAWRQGRLQEAERHFLIGAELVHKERKAVWTTAAGAVAYEDQRVEVALNRFIEAYQLDSMNAAPMLLNNLSAISLSLDRPEDCIRWGELALARHAAFQNDIDAGVGPEFLQYVHFNLFVAYTTLQNVQEATSHWERLDFKNLNAYPIQLAELLSMFARLTDQPALLDLYGEPLRKRIIGFQESGRIDQITYLEDPLVFLFTMEAAPFVDAIGLREAWSQLRPNFALRSAKTTKQVASAEEFPSKLGWKIAFWVISSVGLVFGILMLRLKASRPTSLPRAPWNQLLRGLKDQPMEETERAHLHHVLCDIQRHQKNLQHLAPSQELNVSEQIALRDGIDGIYPKTTAQNHNWTPTYVYILRSSVRNKLGIAPELSFARWKERFPERAEQALFTVSSTKNKA